MYFDNRPLMALVKVREAGRRRQVLGPWRAFGIDRTFQRLCKLQIRRILLVLCKALLLPI